jgi:hypothetical protein
MMPCLFAGVLLCGAAGSASGEPEGREAVIFHIKGDVKVQRAGEAAWNDAYVGVPLQDAAKVRTGLDSEAEIALDGEADNIVCLNEKTEFMIDKKN